MISVKLEVEHETGGTVITNEGSEVVLGTAQNVYIRELLASTLVETAMVYGIHIEDIILATRNASARAMSTAVRATKEH